MNLNFNKLKVLNPKVSIIICTLNSEKYLTQCLESIISQSFKDYEIIVVDGGSVDKTLSIVDVFNISKVFTDIKGGVSCAMNFGITKAIGDIIAILHSDDYYYTKDSLQLVADCFQEKKCNWLYANLVVLKKNGSFRYNKNDIYSMEYLSHTFNIPHPTVFIKKKVYEELGLFNQNYKYAMDYDLLLRVSKKYEPFQIDKFITVFREHEGSLSTSNWSKAQIESLVIQQKHAESIIIKAKGIFRFIKTRLARIKHNLK